MLTRHSARPHSAACWLSPLWLRAPDLDLACALLLPRCASPLLKPASSSATAFVGVGSRVPPNLAHLVPHTSAARHGPDSHFERSREGHRSANLTSVCRRCRCAGLPVGAAGECSNTCVGMPSYASDGYCDDGGPGAQFGDCALGTDCTDCGASACVSPRLTGAGCARESIFVPAD